MRWVCGWFLSFDCDAKRGGTDGASFLQTSRESPCLDQLRSAILGLVELLGEQLDGVVELDHLAHKLSMGVVVARLTKSNSSKEVSCSTKVKLLGHEGWLIRPKLFEPEA